MPLRPEAAVHRAERRLSRLSRPAGRAPGEALRAADRAVWLVQVGDRAERFYGAEMLALIDAATAHLQQAEFEWATEKLAPVLALRGEQRLETFTQRLAEMRDVLRAAGTRRAGCRSSRSRRSRSSGQAHSGSTSAADPHPLTDHRRAHDARRSAAGNRARGDHCHSPGIGSARRAQCGRPTAGGGAP